jgi:hypothetical protein
MCVQQSTSADSFGFISAFVCLPACLQQWAHVGTCCYNAEPQGLILIPSFSLFVTYLSNRGKPCRHHLQYTIYEFSVDTHKVSLELLTPIPGRNTLLTWAVFVPNFFCFSLLAFTQNPMSKVIKLSYLLPHYFHYCLIVCKIIPFYFQFPPKLG